MVISIICGLLIVLWYMVKTYNQAKPLSIQVNESIANIDVIHQKRLNILSKLDSIVEMYSTYEKNIMDKISNDMKNDPSLSFNISRLSDAYPDLKLNHTFSEQIDRLYEIESERQDMVTICNSNIKEFNSTVTNFPSIIICKILGFKEKTFFS